MRSGPARDSSAGTGAPCAAGRFPAGAPACCRPFSSRASAKLALPQRRFRSSSRPAAAAPTLPRPVRPAGRAPGDRAPVPHPHEEFAVGRQSPADRRQTGSRVTPAPASPAARAAFTTRARSGPPTRTLPARKTCSDCSAPPWREYSTRPAISSRVTLDCAQAKIPARASSRSPPPRRARSGAPRRPRAQRSVSPAGGYQPTAASVPSRSNALPRPGDTPLIRSTSESTESKAFTASVRSSNSRVALCANAEANRVPESCRARPSALRTSTTPKAPAGSRSTGEGDPTEETQAKYAPPLRAPASRSLKRKRPASRHDQLSRASATRSR